MILWHRRNVYSMHGNSRIAKAAMVPWFFSVVLNYLSHPRPRVSLCPTPTASVLFSLGSCKKENKKKTRSFKRHEQQNKGERTIKPDGAQAKFKKTHHFYAALIYIPAHKEFSLHIYIYIPSFRLINIPFCTELFWFFVSLLKTKRGKEREISGNS